MNYTEKQIKQLDSVYNFNQIEINKLDINGIYLVKVEVGDMPKHDVFQLCSNLRNKLHELGVTKSLICPCHNGIPGIEFTQLEETK